MRVIIDITDEYYEIICNKIKSIRDEIKHKGYAKDDAVPLGWVQIADGTVLPKGHDELVYRDDAYNYGSLYAPAIIEGDKEE